MTGASLGNVVPIAAQIKKARRPMTAVEKRMALAVAGVVPFSASSSSQSLARSLATMAKSPSPRITEVQAMALRSLVVRYRSQLNESIVAAAVSK